MPYQPPFESAFTNQPFFAGAAEPGRASPFNFMLPGMTGFSGVAAHMFLPPLMHQYMGQYGMMPSQFFPTMGMYDQFASNEYYRNQFMAMQMASRRDTANIQQTIGGIMRMTTGRPLTTQQQQQAFQMAQQMQGALPILSMLFGPDTIDTLMGSRGSAMVMSETLHRAMRTRRDPITGAIGFHGNTAGVVSRELYDQLYGTDAALRQMQGIGAGAAGRLFEELSLRGAMPGGGVVSIQDRLRSIAARSFTEDQQRRMAEAMLTRQGLDITPDNIEGALASFHDTRRQLQAAVTRGGRLDAAALADLPGAEEMLGTADAERIAQRLKNMVGAVNAMRDIFGDMGRPDAPMRELINGLEALTQGGLATSTPGQLEQIVRTTRNLANQSGMGMQTLIGLTAQAANLADQLGLDRGLAVQATQGTAAFAGAIRDTGRLDIPAFGSLTAEKAALLDSQLRMQAAGSLAANSMAALIRMDLEGLIDPGSEAAAAARALQEGRTEYTFNGRTRQIPGSRGSFMRLMRDSGVDQNFARAILEDRAASQQYIRDFNLIDRARERQLEIDIIPRVADIFSASLQHGLRGVNVDANRIAGIVARSFMSMAPEDARDIGRRNAVMANNIRAAVASDIMARGGTPMEVAATLAQLSETDIMQMGTAAIANLSTRIQFDPYLQGYGSVLGLQQMHSATTHQAQRARMLEAQTTARLQSALSRFGRTGPLERIIDTIQRSPAGTPFGRMLAEAFGGVSKEELSQSAPYSAFEAAMAMFHDAERVDGDLTELGLQQRSTASQVIQGLIEGGRDADTGLSVLDAQFGVTDPTQLLSTLDARLSRSDLTAADRDRYEQARTLALGLSAARSGTTLADLARELGIPVDAQVSDKDVSRILELATSADQTRDSTKAAARHSEALRQSRAVAEQLMASTADMQQLGEGSVQMVRKQYDLERELLAMATAAGVTPGELLAGKGPPDAVAKARAKYAELQTGWKRIESIKKAGRMPGHGRAGEVPAMSAGELEIARQTAAFMTGGMFADDLATGEVDLRQLQAEHVVDRLLAATSSDIQNRQMLVDEVLAGDRAVGLAQSLLARDRLAQLASDKGFIKDLATASAEDIQQGIDALMTSGDLTEAEQALVGRFSEMSRPLRGIGRRDVTLSELSERISQIQGVQRPREETKDGNKKLEARITGSVRIENSEVLNIKGDLSSGDLDHAGVATGLVAAGGL